MRHLLSCSISSRSTPLFCAIALLASCSGDLETGTDPQDAAPRGEVGRGESDLGGGDMGPGASDADRSDAPDGNASDADASDTGSPIEVALETAKIEPAPDAIYYVSASGEDGNQVDGLTPKTAWATPGYAASRVPPGAHRVEIGPGTYEVSEPIAFAAGISVRGAGARGPEKTLLVPAEEWLFEDGSPETRAGYLVEIVGKRGVSWESVAFRNNTQGGAKAAIYTERGHDARLIDLHIEGFSLAGIVANRSERVEIARSTFVETAGRTGKGVTVGLDGQNRSFLGAITLIFIKPALVHHNTIMESDAIGIKGFGIEERSLIYANRIGGKKFALEAPHKNERGLRIFHNEFDHWLSVPKNGTYSPGPDGYTIRIHDNIVRTPVGAIEGPRSHLEIDHNFFVFSNIGRVYENHGGRIEGPVWIHHNVATRTPMDFYWDRGSMTDVHLLHNTVAFDEDHGNYVLGLSSGPFERFSVLNNVFVAPASRPGKALTSMMPEPLAIEHNIFENIDMARIPAASMATNYGGAPGLSGEGRVRIPQPGGRAIDAALVTSERLFSGRAIGHPIVGAAPDIGAFEAGAEIAYAPCEARLGASAPKKVSCAEGALLLEGAQAKEWVTMHWEGLLPGAYTLRAELRAPQGTAPVSIWTGAPGALTDWTLPIDFATDEEQTPWLGEVVVGASGELSVRLLASERSEGAIEVRRIMLTPRF